MKVHCGIGLPAYININTILLVIRISIIYIYMYICIYTAFAKRSYFCDRNSYIGNISSLYEIIPVMSTSFLFSADPAFIIDTGISCTRGQWSYILTYYTTGKRRSCMSSWRHQMETFSALLALRAENSLVTGELMTSSWYRNVTSSLTNSIYMYICIYIYSFKL